MIKLFFTRFRAPFALGILSCLGLGGCLDKRIVWSADGSRAALVGNDGLYLCDASGHLSDLAVPGVYLADWLGDSRHLVLAQARDIKDTADLASIVGRARADQLAAKSERVWQGLLAGRSPDDLGKEEGSDMMAEVVFLRERHADALHKLLGKKWDDVAGLAVSLHSIVLGELEGDRVKSEKTLRRDLSAVREMRPSPDGKTIAFVTGLDPEPDKEFRISVVPTDGSAAPKIVADHTAIFPDWTADGRFLEYLQASGTGGSNDLKLGALVRRQIVGQDGSLHVADATTEQVGLVFHYEDRVRCLKDGRVFFSATEYHLPMASRPDDGREQLFEYSPAKENSVVSVVPTDQLAKLPAALACFEVSPDETQVLFGGDVDGNCVSVLSLKTGEVQTILAKIEKKDNIPAPAWRLPGEFTYARETKSTDGLLNRSVIEIVLRSNGKEVVLSHQWPADMADKFVY